MLSRGTLIFIVLSNQIYIIEPPSDASDEKLAIAAKNAANLFHFQAKKGSVFDFFELITFWIFLINIFFRIKLICFILTYSNETR